MALFKWCFFFFVIFLYRYKVQAIEGAFNRLTYELIINGVEDGDYGNYKCQIKNDQGTTTRTIQLIRKYSAL